jgi:N-acetylneuraminate lyase
MKNIQGLIAATFTPLKSDGQLNLEAIGPYAECLKRDKVDGVFLNGSTGDFPSLTLKERKLVVEEWSKCRPSELKLIVHVGDTSLENARQLARHAGKFQVDAISALAPYYYKPASLGHLVQFCKEISDHSPETPFYYYHIPSLTGVNFDMVQFMELASTNITYFGGLKYSDEDLSQFKRCLDFENGRYDVFFGVDEILLSALVLGAKGAVGSTYNHLTPLHHRLIAAFENGAVEKASSLQKQVMIFVKVLSQYGYHAASKFILNLQGLKLGPVRLPLGNLTSSEEEAVRNEIMESGIFDEVEKSRSSIKRRY